MTRSGIRYLAVAALAGLVLAGCEKGAGPFAGAGSGGAGTGGAEGDAAPATGGAAATPASSVRLVDRDVEAPEVFQVTESGLWDGRPSLGGVWVASPDAKDPERVIIRNPGNGKFVIGALFRRERDNPGPKLQISSDAAAALGLLAGQPGELNVTALRREEGPVATPAAEAPILDTAETIETEALDPVAVASAAIDAAEGKPAAAAPAAVAQTPAPVATSGGKPLIQIGIFSVEANATRAADLVTKAGAPAQVRKDESKGKPYWSVLAGPATTRAEQTALMAKVKGLGFKDAYFVAR